MKKFYLFFVLMLVSLSTAFAQMPTFTPAGTADDAATWYYVQFESTKLVASTYENESYAPMRCVFPSLDEGQQAQQLFKLEGTPEGFNLISKDGYHFYWNDAIKLEKESDNAVADRYILKLEQGGNDTYKGDEFFQIRLVGKESWGGRTRALQPAGGEKRAGNGVGAWEITDPTTVIRFVKADEMKTEGVRPVIKQAFEPNAKEWYQILFKKQPAKDSHKYIALTSAGEGNKLIQKTQLTDLTDPTINNQLWQLVGTDDQNVKFVNRNGEAIILHSSGRFAVSKTATPQMFKQKDFPATMDFYPIKNANIFQFLKVEDNRSFNASGDPHSGGEIGHWGVDRIDCELAFVPVTLAEKEELCSVTLKKTGYNEYLTPVTLGGLTDGKIKKGDKLRITVAPKGFFEITISANGNVIQKPKMVASSKELVQEVTITEDTEIVVDVQTGVMIDLYVDDDATSEKGNVELEGTVKSGGLKAAHGQEVTVDARPNDGYKIKQIKVTDMATMQEQDITDSKIFTATADAYGVEVWFVPINGGADEEECSITKSASGPKSTYAMVDISEESVKKGESITLTATPMTTAEVLVYINNEKVYGPAIASGQEPLETELTINEDAVIEVVFNNPATIKLDTEEVPNGTILLNNKELKDVSMGFLHNQEVTVEASPNEGYVLESIKVKVKGATDFTDISSTKKFTATEDDYVLQVNFVKAEAEKKALRIYLTKDHAKTLVLKDETGTAVEMPQQNTDASGDTYYDFSLTVGVKYGLEVTAKDGYEVKDMDTNFIGKVLNNEFNFTPTEGQENHILVNLQPKKMEVKFPKWEHGSVDRKGWAKPVHKIKFGQVIKLAVKAEEGYELESLTVGGVDVSQTLEFTVGLDNTIVAKFKKIVVKKAITIPTVQNGTLTLDGVNSGDEVAVGTEVAITATPADGYELEAITVGGVDVTEAKKFVVGDDNTIVVKFRKVKATAIEGLDAQIRLYPNPATDYAIVSGLQANEMVKLISLTGKTVLVKKADYTGQVRLELSKLTGGLYIVRTTNKVFKLQVQ